MKKKLSRTSLSSGFTFIELLVSVMILALIFTIGYGNYRDFARRQRIEAATRLVKGDLRLAQQQAVSGQKFGANCSAANAELQGYRVRTVSAREYWIIAECLVGASTRRDTLKQVNISQDYPDVSISGLGGGVNGGVLFYALAQGASVNRTVTIDDTNISGPEGTRTIQITTGGEIN